MRQIEASVDSEVLAERIDSIRPLYRRIGTDVMVATRQGDTQKCNALVALVMALEKTYPDEMAALRAEK